MVFTQHRQDPTDRVPHLRDLRLRSFLVAIVLVMLGLALSTQPAVGRLFDGLAALTLFILAALITSLFVWLALSGSA